METIINNSRQLSSLPYTNCKTRIVSLKELDLPETASDEEYRQIYHRYIQSAETNTNAALLRDAVESIRHGLAPPVAFPTETVYGLGADATSEAAIAGIFAAKGRPSDNPLIVHAASVAHLERLTGQPLPEIYRGLAKRFWPGPLTILLPVPERPKSQFAKNVHPGQSTIGFRIPSSKYARFFIAAADRPIAGPSANSSGKPSPTTAQHVFDDLKGKINFILDAGHCDVGVESTVVDGLHDPPLILRPGGVSQAEFVAHGREQGNRFAYTAIGYKRHKTNTSTPSTPVTPGQQQSSSPPSPSASASASSTTSSASAPTQQQDTPNHYLLNNDDDTEAPRAPGMKYRHYAPKGRLILFSEPAIRAGKVQTKFDELLAQTTTAAQETDDKTINVGIISCHWAPFAGLAGLSSPSPAPAEFPTVVSSCIYAPLTSMATLTETNNLKVTVYDVRIGSDIKDLAHSLFGVLRLFDDLDCRFILAETVQQQQQWSDSRDGIQGGSGGNGGNDATSTTSSTRDIVDAVVDRIEKAAAERVD
ncbi:Threonylcarbamoyl-AMP synthase [Exophiala dermatitidis]